MLGYMTKGLSRLCVTLNTTIDNDNRELVKDNRHKG